MELVDELMTPGCPQCAVKHLSAALYHAAEIGLVPARCGICDSAVLIARAYINLGEVMIGYKSHLWFAVGLLQRAEERSITEGFPSRAARDARLTLEERGADAVLETMRNLAIDVHLDHAVMCAAHLGEAVRELPRFPWSGFNDIPAVIEEIRREYFGAAEDRRDGFFKKDQEVAVDTSEEVAGKGGEEAMATKKAAKAKVDPKAAQAACKGGKAKKAACKGGKCKK